MAEIFSNLCAFFVFYIVIFGSPAWITAVILLLATWPRKNTDLELRKEKIKKLSLPKYKPENVNAAFILATITIVVIRLLWAAPL